MTDSRDESAEYHATVKAVLLSALTREGEERRRFLDHACAGDEALRAEVEDLLAEEEEEEGEEDFLEIPAVLALSDSPDVVSAALNAPTPMPEQIGPFRLLDKLGEGGMGTVYLAEQIEPVRRMVALKVISTRFANRQRRIRFAAECQALARLSHPNIASLYEAGTTRTGQPFVALEWVEGIPIHSYADEHHLDLGERLELFLGVCAGVQHAHQKGILHRDLKPSNILVTEIDGHPVVKVIDFGIAKALDQPLVAETMQTAGQVIGSPAYMSPEAAVLGDERDLDTRADIYSLGVLLHELLLGVRRFADHGSGIGPLLRRIAEEEPTRPSSRWQALDGEERQRLAALRGLDEGTLGRRLQGDLDAIVLKAMARDRERRYNSIAELAADIRRHLAHQPILARPPSLPYLWSRFLRRHATAAALVVALLLLLLLGVGLLTRETQRARRAEEQARQALAEAQQVSDFLVELFEGSDPETAPGESTTLREILDRGADRLNTELAEQPLVRARLLQTIGDVYLSLGLLEEARQRVEEALALRRAELPPDHPETVWSLNQLGILHRRAGRYDEAEALLRRVVALREGAAEPDPLTLAQAHSNLGNLLWNQGHYQEAEAGYQRALEIQREAFGEDHREVGATLLNLGTVYWSQGRLDEAQPLFERSIEILEAALGPDNPRVTAAWNNLGILLEARGELDRGEEIHHRNLATWERVLGPEHPDVAVALQNLGINAIRRKHFEEAENFLLRALEIRTDAFGTDHPLVQQTRSRLASLARERGRPEEAEALYREVLAARESALGPDHPDVAPTLSSLAQLLHETGRPAAAVPLYRRCLAILEGVYGETHPSVPRTLYRLARTLLEQESEVGRAERRVEAEALLHRALALRQAAPGDDSPAVEEIRATLEQFF